MENNKLLSTTFMWMFFGLLVCFGVSYFSTLDLEIIKHVYLGMNGMSYIIFMILELVIAFSFHIMIRKLSPLMAKIFYLLYCGLTGLSLSGIFVVYKLGSIAFAFLATAIVFGIFALIGRNTKYDLSKFGIYLFVALIAIIIVEIINIFIMSNTLNMLTIILTIVIFSVYIAYDINMLLKSGFLDDVPENKPIYFAFQLFVDFINIFIEILRLVGEARD